MKILFEGLGSISTKHIFDLVSILKSKSINVEIVVLRRNITQLEEKIEGVITRQITELDDTFYDIAFITNPTTEHYNSIKQLKGKVKYYFIEKPIFEKPVDSFFELGINESNAYIAAPLRHSAVFKNLKEITTNNKVFSSRIICSSYLPDWRPNIDYRKNYSAIKELGGGVTLDLIHELDYMVGLFGLPEKVFNIHGKYSNLEITSDDLSVYIAKYRELLCEVHLDYFGRQYKRSCELYTEDGTYVADFYKSEILYPNGDILECSNEGKTNLYLELEYFIDFVLGDIKENVNPPSLANEVLKITLGEY